MGFELRVLAALYVIVGFLAFANHAIRENFADAIPSDGYGRCPGNYSTRPWSLMGSVYCWPVERGGN